MKTVRTKNYKERIAENELNNLLHDFGAVLIRGPKGCGKTTIGEFVSNSAVYLSDPDRYEDYLNIALNKPSILLRGDKPRLLDEWQVFPPLWDGVRDYCDKTLEKGGFVLTGSYAPKKGATKHTGTMRIATLDMETLSLFESGESSGEISLQNLLNGQKEVYGTAMLGSDDITSVIVRGGWPIAVFAQPAKPESYGRQALRNLCDRDIIEATGKELSPTTTQAIVASFARNLGTQALNKTIVTDVNERGRKLSEPSFYEYLDGLKRLFVIRELPAWNPNIRSRTTMRSSPKRYFHDTSLAAAALNLSVNDLSYDYKTRGLFFENLCLRDLVVYARSFGCDVSYYRDRFRLECDLVVHLGPNKLGLFECKCGPHHIKEGAEHLNKLKELIEQHNKEHPHSKIPSPVCMAIITDGDQAYTRTDGIHIIPLSCLRP